MGLSKIQKISIEIFRIFKIQIFQYYQHSIPSTLLNHQPQLNPQVKKLTPSKLQDRQDKRLVIPTMKNSFQTKIEKPIFLTLLARGRLR